MKNVARTLTREEIFELPAEERLNLMDSLWDSLTPADVPLEQWQQRLLDERLEAHEHDPEAARPWEDIRDEIFPPRR
jgi:putative addiction module component (TIGR02574 family)